MKLKPLSKKVGLLIRRLRSESGLSQEAFADMCGIHRAYMGAIERGENSFTLETLEKVIVGLNLSFSAFFLLLENETDSAKVSKTSLPSSKVSELKESQNELTPKKPRRSRKIT